MHKRKEYHSRHNDQHSRHETADYTKMVKFYAWSSGANSDCYTNGNPGHTLTQVDILRFRESGTKLK